MPDDASWHPLDLADDRILAGRAADGDTAAFAVLVRRYTPMMRAYSRRLLNDGDEVDDVVQEAFVTAWMSLPQLADSAAVKPWLMRIVSRKSIDYLRRHHPHDSLEDAADSTPAHRSPAQQVEARIALEELDMAVRDLSPSQRACWTMREMGGYSYEEIAEQMRLPISTVRGLLARARQHILLRMGSWR